MKKNEPVIDYKKAIHEKETMQKHYVRKNGCKSYVLSLVIEYLKKQWKSSKH